MDEQGGTYAAASSNDGNPATMEVFSTIKLIDNNLPLDDGIGDGTAILHNSTISSKDNNVTGDCESARAMRAQRIAEDDRRAGGAG